MLSRHHQLAWALLLAGLGLFLLPRMIRMWRGELISVETPPRYSARFVVDINRADWPEFAVLPGIGDRLAKRIVEFRAEHGPFRQPEDLLRVPGIGPKTFSQIQRHVTLTLPESSDACRGAPPADTACDQREHLRP